VFSRRPPIKGQFYAPASKPETQRALICAALAEGTSVLSQPLVSRETQAMIDAVRALGAEVDTLDDEIRVTGIAGQGRVQRSGGSGYVWASGSALVARLMTTIGTALGDRLIIDGNCVLRGRPFASLFSALRAKGVCFQFFDGEDRLPCATISPHLPGGHYRLATSVSSQFVTALMIPAPLAKSTTTIALSGPHYSLSYINQTIDMMRRFGVAVEVSDDAREISVRPSGWYAPRRVQITGDYTSASYILGAAVVTRGNIVVANLDPESLQGERAIVDVVRDLGAKIRWLDEPHTLAVDCSELGAPVDAEVDLQDCPNILPTVAAIAATVPGRVRITGARLTQFHKCPRVEAMATELAKAGVPVTILRGADGAVDGLEVRGSTVHRGNVSFSSHGDHRIFMSLALFALSCTQPCLFSESGDTSDSFPDFLSFLGLDEDRLQGIA
jgi:3-phosphoshikimate 1-carboxyvinyltransferase